MVEAQHRVSTMKLVDSLEEQELLETLLETSKPPFPPACRHLDWLLATPFRYGAFYPTGSRFRRAGMTPGVFYAAEGLATAVAEMAFYRLLFFADSPATPWPVNPGEYTAFGILYATSRAIDLTEPPFLEQRDVWTHPTDYAGCQTLADTARTAEVEVIRYASARDPAGGADLALLSARAFAAPEPQERQTWRLRFGPHGVMAIGEFPPCRLNFDRDAFPDPRLAGMQWVR